MRNDSGENQKGGLRGGLLMWLIGVPIPVILLFSLFKGC